MARNITGSVVKTRHRSDSKTVGNVEWVDAVRTLCLAGTPIPAIRTALREKGLYVPRRSTLENYIREGRVLDVNWTEYLSKIIQVTEREYFIQESERADPRFKVWRNLTTAMLRNGCAMTVISDDLKKRGLQPYSIESLQKYLEEGYFHDMTPASYQEAVDGRELRRSAQWMECVHPMALKGCSGTEICEKLKEEHLEPDILSTVLRYIKAGKVPGLSAAQYDRLVEERRFGQKDQWVAIVKECLERGDSLGAIQRKLKAAGLSQHSPKTVLRLIEAGYIPGYTWDKQNNPFWHNTVFDLLYEGRSIDAIHRELESLGLRPASSMIIRNRLRSGEIKKRMPDGTVRTMDMDLYAERVKVTSLDRKRKRETEGRNLQTCAFRNEGGSGGTHLNAIFKYPGSKWSISGWIVNHFPEHHSYLEPFFGSGAVLLSKSRSDIETINDLDGDVINLFRWVQSDPERLAKALYWTPFSREVYDRAWGKTPTEGDSLQKAVDFLIRMMMGYGARSSFAKVGWKNDVQGREKAYAALDWCEMPDKVLAAAKRLRGVQIENMPAIDLIERFNSSDVLIYADPPYLHSTRQGMQYRHEMTSEEHAQMLDALRAHKGPVILSGYDNDLYNDVLRDWSRDEISVLAQNGAERKEVLWMNFAAAEQLSIFEGGQMCEREESHV